MDTLQYPTGTTVSMTCDAKGRTTIMALGAAASAPKIVKDVPYLPADQIVSMTCGNALNVTYTLENARLKRIQTPGVLDLSYTYYGSNNVKSLNDALHADGTIVNAQYDSLDRLTDVKLSNGTDLSFVYDALG